MFSTGHTLLSCKKRQNKQNKSSEYKLPVVWGGYSVVEGYQLHRHIKHGFAVFSFSLIGEKKIIVFELLPQIIIDVTLSEIRPSLKILRADQRDTY